MVSLSLAPAPRARMRSPPAPSTTPESPARSAGLEPPAHRPRPRRPRQHHSWPPRRHALEHPHRLDHLRPARTPGAGRRGRLHHRPEPASGDCAWPRLQLSGFPRARLPQRGIDADEEASRWSASSSPQRRCRAGAENWSCASRGRIRCRDTATCSRTDISEARPQIHEVNFPDSGVRPVRPTIAIPIKRQVSVDRSEVRR
jgi:hypothetical protein